MLHVIEVLEYRTIDGAPWAKVRTGQQPEPEWRHPEWRPLAELVLVVTPRRGAA